MVTGEIVRRAIFGLVGLSTFAVDARLRRQGRASARPNGARDRFAGAGLARYLLRSATVLGVVATALLVLPAAIRQELAPATPFGWVPPVAGVGLLYLVLKTLALWRTARLLSKVGDESLLAMCSGRG